MEENMIYTVTVNPCLDEDKYFDEQSELMIGTNRANGSKKYPGGKGIDVSRAIHAAGSRSIATGFIGGHIGKLIQGLLAIEGIDCEFIEVRTETRTNVICHMNTGEEIRINSEGPEISGEEYLDLLKKIRSFEDASAGLVSGSVCAGMESIHSYNQILSAFKQHRHECLTFLDTDEKHTMAALDGAFPPDFIKPNIYEFHKLLRVRVDPKGIATKGMDPSTVTEEDLIKYYCNIHEDLPIAWETLAKRLETFAQRYPNVHVLLSISKFGVLTFDKADGKLAHSFYCGDVELKTTVGAGDSFLGGFVTSYVGNNQRNLAEALLAGVATAVARLQGQNRDFGYIDQERLQEVRSSSALKFNKFKVVDAAEYSKENLFQCFMKNKEQDEASENILPPE
jgi:fructose-1-phosphate kinase PfkB-like protein